jgi:hypothetical protein
VRYPLASLLPLRERAERARALDRSAAARDLARALVELERREEVASREAALCRGPERAPGAVGSSWQMEARHAAHRREIWRAAERLRAEACAAVAGARSVLDARREALAVAARDRAALVRHRDAWYAARRRAREEAEDVEAEEARSGRGGG